MSLADDEDALAAELLRRAKSIKGFTIERALLVAIVVFDELRDVRLAHARLREFSRYNYPALPKLQWLDRSTAAAIERAWNAGGVLVCRA